MIFRWLYRRRLDRVFAEFHAAHGLEFVDPIWHGLTPLSEWAALKALLPLRWFYTPEQIADGNRQVMLDALKALRDSKRDQSSD